MEADRSEPSPSEDYLVIRAPGFHWALPALRVRRIVRVEEWTGSAPFDPLRPLLAAELPECASPRVLVVDAGTRSFALLTRSPVEVHALEREQIWSLPELVTTSAARELVEGVVLSADSSIEPWFVLALVGLDRAERAASAGADVSGCETLPSPGE